MASYEKHLVAFVDLLGFREALRDEKRSDKILQLLTSISEFKGEFLIESMPADRGRSTEVRPAISAFSDNVVISYPVKTLAEHGLSTVLAMHLLQNLVSYIAWRAFEVDLLVRGGISIGDLYHKKDVVFGPALVEAYETEQTVSIYPRIAFAPSVERIEDFDKWKHNFYRHEDGVFVLNYFLGFVIRTPPGGGKFNTMVKPWVAHVREVVTAQMAALTTEGNQKALIKWSWFKNDLERNLKLLDSPLLEMETPNTGEFSSVAPNTEIHSV